MIWVITGIIIWSILGVIVCTSIEESLKKPDQPKDIYRVARKYILDRGPNAAINRSKNFKISLSLFGYGTMVLVFLGVAALGWKLALVFLPLTALVIWRGKKTIDELRRYGWLITASEYQQLTKSRDKSI